MRRGASNITLVLVAILALAVSGCAQNKPMGKSSTTMAASPVPRAYAPSPATSLVFDPPVTIGQPPLQLSREARTPDAFVSYDSLTTTYFYLQTDDGAIGYPFERYQRRAITTKVGVSYR
jgi:hypothetical protein